MAKKKKDATNADDPQANACLITSDEDKNKARRWFERAREIGDKRQYDYAIEYFISGLEYWPDGVEDGCKPLHGCAVARKHNGGTKPGFKDGMKYSMGAKDARQALMNALWLFGHDPDNASYADGLLKNACRLRSDDTAMWAGGVLLKALEANPKAGVKQFLGLVGHLEELGDRAAQRKDAPLAEQAYQTGVAALNTLQRRVPNDRQVDKALRNLSTNLTILKGKYKDSGSFRESMADLDEQMDRHDRERTVQSDERVEELISAAQERFREQPDSDEMFKGLIDLLLRRERLEDELQAMGLLVERYKSSDDYRWKMMADDLRIKQLTREVRQARAEGDAKVIRERQIKQLRFELSVFKERVEQYPTDNRVKFEYGVRNFRAGRWDAAIPVLQAARTDPKNKTACALYLGRCFFKKAYHDQAIQTLAEAISEHEFTDDDLAKEMLYWMGRVQEASGAAEDARKTFGKVLQLDYTYRDTRDRLDRLSAGG